MSEAVQVRVVRGRPHVRMDGRWKPLAAAPPQPANGSRGVAMRSGAGWRLVTPGGASVAATLLGTHYVGGQRVALFSAPQRRKLRADEAKE